MRKSISLAVLLVASTIGAAQAEVYGVIGAGLDTHDSSVVPQLGVGYNFGNGIRTEVDYRSMSLSNQADGREVQTGTQSQPVILNNGQPQRCTSGTAGCNGGILYQSVPVYTPGISSSKVQGVGLSALVDLPEWAGAVPYVRVGALYSKQNYTGSYTPVTAWAGNTTVTTVSKNKLTPMLGAGLEFGKIGFEVTAYPKLRYWANGYETVTVVSGHYRF